MPKIPLLMLWLLVSAMGLAACDPAPEDDEPAPTPGLTETPTATTLAEPCDPGTYKIAYQGPLTGDYAALGENMINGVSLAVREASDAGDLGEGVDVEVVAFDSQGSGDQAPPLAHQAAADEDIVAMVGPAFWGETRVSGPILDDAGLPFITPSATKPELSEQGWEHFFRTIGSDREQGPVAAAFIAGDLGASTVAIIDDASDYGGTLADFVEQTLEGQLDTEVVERQHVEPGQQDYSAAVARVAQADADAIFFGGYYPEAGLIKRQLAAAGAGDIPFVSDDGTFDTDYFEVAGADTAEPSYVTYPGIDVTAADSDFVDSYESEYGTQPGAFSVEAYQNARIILEALRNGACRREAVREFIAGFSGEIAGKQISFDANGDIAAPRFTVYRAQTGAWVVEDTGLAPPGADGDEGATEAATEPDDEVSLGAAQGRPSRSSSDSGSGPSRSSSDSGSGPRGRP